MKIAVTGCAGFIGSHTVEALLDHGHDVIGFDDLRNGYESNLRDHTNFKLYKIDVAFIKPSDLEGCQAVVHLAATGSVPRSIQLPSVTTQNNIMGFQAVLESARLAGVKRVVYASSSSIYGHGQYNPLSPYAMTKQVNEMQAEQYNIHYGMECIGLRYFNVFGPRQGQYSDYSAVIAKWVSAFNAKKPIIIHGDGKQSRDFTYIKNVVDANLLAIDAKFHKSMCLFDIGCGNSHSLNYLASELEHVLGYRPERIYERERTGDIGYSKANIQPAIQHLDFQARFGLRDGLKDWLTPDRVVLTSQPRPYQAYPQ